MPNRTLSLLPALAMTLLSSFAVGDNDEIKARIAIEMALLKLQEPPLAPKQEPKVVVLEGWPSGVEMPRRMRWFRKTRYNQYLAINNSRDYLTMFRLDQDQHFANSAPFINPNHTFPWAVSGGLHESSGWSSRAAVALPENGKVVTWWQLQEIGASRPQWKMRWSWPVGTTFADVLSTDKGVFEVRTLTKSKYGWEPEVIHKDAANAPANYRGARKECLSCHSGEGYNGNYGPQLRLEDGIFSASPLKEGTIELDTERWPIERWKP